MTNDLISKSIKVTSRQVEWVLERSGNFSRYVRTLIDREMGAEDARALVTATREQYDTGNTQQKNQPEKLVWRL